MIKDEVIQQNFVKTVARTNEESYIQTCIYKEIDLYLPIDLTDIYLSIFSVDCISRLIDMYLFLCINKSAKNHIDLVGPGNSFNNPTDRHDPALILNC